MSATVSEIAEGIKANLTQIQGLRVVDYISDKLTPPVALVGIESVVYHRSFSGGDPVYTYTVSVIVARADTRIAQRKLDEFLSFDSTNSIRRAIERDTSLDGTAQTCIVDRGGNISTVAINDVIYLSVDFTVTVHA
jgi:hypothetical protein